MVNKYTKEELKQIKSDIKFKKVEAKKLKLQAKAEREGKIAAEYDEIAKTKEKLKEYRGKQPIVKTARAFGEGVVVGIKKGASAIRREAPRAARALSSVVGQTGKTKVGMPSLFGSSGFGSGERKEAPSYFAPEKEYRQKMSGWLFGEPEKPKVTPTVKRKKKGKKSTRSIVVSGVTYYAKLRRKRRR